MSTATAAAKGMDSCNVPGMEEFVESNDAPGSTKEAEPTNITGMLSGVVPGNATNAGRDAEAHSAII